MSEVDPFYTDTDLDIYGDERKAVYHYRSECEYGQKVKRDHNDVSGKGVGRRPCKECDRKAAVK
jgi:predicted SprT family Zn-dependent metalloprotease